MALINAGQFAKAHPFCVQILQQQPDHADAYFLLGIINLEVGQVFKAAELLKRANGLHSSGEYAAHYARALAMIGDADAVDDLARQFAPESIDSALTLDTFGVALSRVSAHEAAVPYFEKAISLKDDNPRFYYNVGVSRKFCGEFAPARLAFERAISLAPDYYQAHFALSDLGGIAARDNHIDRLLQARERLKTSVDGSLHIGHALNKEYEALGLYQHAFEALQQAKHTRLVALEGESDKSAEIFAWLEKQTLEAPRETGHASQQPIFIVGMPRSGTTLVERILSSHSRVTSAGELQDFGVAVKELANTAGQHVLDLTTLQAGAELDGKALAERYLQRTKVVAGDTAHFTDKLPFNFYYVPLILRAFPNARIVWLMRDPMDTCMGNYRQLFSIHNPHYHYAYDLKQLGQFFASFFHLTKAWRNQCPDNLRFLDYQELVSEPEQSIRGLLDFCGLPFEPQCLDMQDNAAPVATASNVQVREGISTKYVGRWRGYQAFVQPLMDSLQAGGIPVDKG